MTKKRTVPEVRFRGFEGEWEESALGELADIVRGASPRPIKDPKWFDDQSDVGWLRISDVTEQNGRITYLEQHLSGLGQDKTRVLFDQHLLLSIAATIGKPVINYVKTGVHDGFLIFQNPNFEHEFMFQWLDNFRPQWKRYGQPGSQVNLNSDLVKNHEFFLPKLAEQTRIGELFSNLDARITQEQCKHEKLQNIKKAMLEKMFPNPGATEPEVRFKGFSGEWEEKKLDDLSSKFQSGEFIKANEIAQNGPYPVFGGNGLRGYAHTYNHDGEFTLIGRQGALCGNAKYIFEQAYITEHAIAVSANSENNTLFLYYLFGIMNLGQYSGQSAQPGLAVGNLILLNTLVPDNAEQTRIGEFFRNLDALITQQQRKCEKLQNIKKAMLGKMFV